IVLSIKDKLNYLEQPIPVAPAGQQVAHEILAAHTAWVKGSKEIAGLMLMTMKPEIQRNLEPLHAHEMLKELKTLFAQQAEQELLQITRDFHSRRNRTLLDMVQSMMSQTTLPKSFWDYAFETAVRILNMIPTKKVEKTTYKDTQRKQWVILSTIHAEFLENSFITQEASGSLEDLKIIQKEDMNPSIDGSLNHEEDDLEIDEPQSDIIPIFVGPQRHDMPRFKWLFKKKTDMDGAVHTYKARLVANGYTQTLRIDYEETFSLVADITAIRILIAIAAFSDYEIWQMDVKTTFLNGYLSEEVYMEQPEGFVNPK
nr:retrotransposon protein, putative, Ty1-copia subclass [Tanacetum cinerariifolium]